MDEQLQKQLLALLKDKLQVKIEFKESECLGKELKVQLFLDKELISEDTNSLDNYKY